MKTSKYFFYYTFAFGLLLSSYSCSNRSAGSISRAMNQAKKDKRYFIMHSGVDVYTVKQVEVERNRKQFTVYLDRIDSLNIVTTNNPVGKRYVPKKGEPIKPEIHMYMKDSTSYTLDEPHTIPVDKVARIEKVD